MADQSYTCAGALAKDPDLRFTQGAMAIATFRIGVSNRKLVDGKWEDNPVFHTCTAFGSLAENIAESCNKGTRVIVSGVFKERKYETDSGDKRTVMELHCEDVAPSLKWSTCQITKNPRKDHS